MKLNSAAITMLLFLILSHLSAVSQVAVKTNLLYDATTTPNLGLEIATAQRQTVQIVYGYNPWTFNDGRKLKHWVLQPEYRWWMCSAFNGLFIGAHAMGGQFNAARVDIPLPGAFFGGDNLRTMAKDYRVEAAFAGAGATCGYQWILGRHFNIEAEVGVGYNHVWYRQYPCAECGSRISKGNSNYIGLTKLGLSLLYLF